ncbi:MAG TPA: MBL fold metallo-hydrolase [Longimicrobiales bacterium]|nr:MBL fold metallo-hydrolase [Longimicrobiales bacterium]
MIREISPGFLWIQECGPNREEFAARWGASASDWYHAGREVHIPQNAWLFRGEKTLLFDTLSPAAGDHVVDLVRTALGGRPLDYLVVSHPDVPHAGNTMKLLRAHPAATLVAPAIGSTHELYHLEDALKVAPGDTLDLGGFRVRFHEATFLDAAMSHWMTEETTRTLLPVDWLGFPHMDGECLKRVEEIDSPITVSRLTEFHGRVMFWFQYVDVDRVNAEIDRLMREFGDYQIAPSHGLVVTRGAREYMARMKEVVRWVSENGRLGVL